MQQDNGKDCNGYALSRRNAGMFGQITERLVGTPGLEPGSLAAADFKSAVFTNFTMLPISDNGITKFHAFANLMLRYFET